MAKVKIGQWELEEDELEQQHQAAVQQGANKAQSEPQAQTVTYDSATNRLVIELKNGVIFQLPCPLIQGLGDVSAEAIAQVRLGPRGASLDWGNLDLDFSLAGLLAGIWGTQVWMVELGRTGVVLPGRRKQPRRGPMAKRRPSGTDTPTERIKDKAGRF